MTVSGARMAALGSVTMRSTVASVLDVSQRMSSGTSVPGPRTWRSISPRLTVSRHVVPRSTVGAAGRSFASTTVTNTTTSRVTTEKAIRFSFFFLATSGERAISMLCLDLALSGARQQAPGALESQALCQSGTGLQDYIDE